MSGLRTCCWVIAVAWLAMANTAAANTIVVGEDDGAVYDGIIDGYPGIVPHDGEPDLGDNALGVAIKTGVTEERAIIELPLAAVRAAVAQVASATFTFNIDDVIGSFGPGTEFIERACRQLWVHTYRGNGQIDLLDFKRIESSGHSVSTTAHGNITDATLAVTGPLRFDVNITSDVNALLAADATHLGIVMRCTDSPTGTSLDNLGDTSSGEPGINGSFMPYLSVELAGPPTATPSPTSTPTPSATPSPSFTATATSTSMSTATPTATVPATATHTATIVVTPDQSPTPTPTAPPCTQDCDGDGKVSPIELAGLIGDALAGRSSSCPGASGNSLVTVDTIVAAVQQAQQGCTTVTAAAAEKTRP